MLYLDLFLVGLGAVAGGWACRRLGVPEVLGYLAAGVLLGPATQPGTSFVQAETITAIAAFAVLFRMFTLGLDFDARRLRGRWRPALAAGLLEMSLCTLAGMLLAVPMGWSLLEGAVLGAALGTTSTNILSRALADRGMGTREDARAAGAATLAEDLIAMGLIALLTVFSGAGGVADVVERALLLVVFASLAFTAGAILVPVALDRLGRSKSDELVTLAVMGGLFGFAALSFGLGAGVAVGAFLAGVAVGAARHAPGVTQRVLPLRDVLAAVAYVSLGLLLDPVVILRVAPIAIPVVLGFVALKSTAVALGLRLGGVAAVTSARAGAILGQAGTMGLVFVCRTFLDPAHVAELLAFAFVAWALTVGLTPIRLRWGPDVAERIARAFRAGDQAPRSARLRGGAEPEVRADARAAVLAVACAVAIGALAGLATDAGAVALPLLAHPYAGALVGLLAGAAVLPFALVAGAATRRASRARIHRAAMAPTHLSKGRRDPAREASIVATLAALGASLALPLVVAVSLVPHDATRLALGAGMLVGGALVALRPRAADRLVERCEALTRARVRDVESPVSDFRGSNPHAFEVEAHRVRPGTQAAWATLRALRLPERSGARVVALLRYRSREPIAFCADTALHPGDEVVIGGSPAQLAEARRLLHEPGSVALEHDAAAQHRHVDADVGKTVSRVP